MLELIKHSIKWTISQIFDLVLITLSPLMLYIKLQSTLTQGLNSDSTLIRLISMMIKSLMSISLIYLTLTLLPHTVNETLYFVFQSPFMQPILISTSLYSMAYLILHIVCQFNPSIHLNPIQKQSLSSKEDPSDSKFNRITLQALIDQHGMNFILMTASILIALNPFIWIHLPLIEYKSMLFQSIILHLLIVIGKPFICDVLKPLLSLRIFKHSVFTTILVGPPLALILLSKSPRALFLEFNKSKPSNGVKAIVLLITALSITAAWTIPPLIIPSIFENMTLHILSFISGLCILSFGIILILAPYQYFTQSTHKKDSASEASQSPENSDPEHSPIYSMCTQATGAPHSSNPKTHLPNGENTTDLRL